MMVFSLRCYARCLYDITPPLFESGVPHHPWFDLARVIGSWVLNSAFGLQLSASLTDAVNHGIPLVFQIQSQIRRPRWYWVDEALFFGHADRRLTYNALVRNYRVTEGQDGRNFQSLQDALDYVARPVSWTVPGGRLRAGEPVEILVRFRLDPAFLPKPFQVVSFGDRDWRLDSDWRTTRLNVPPMMGAK